MIGRGNFLTRLESAAIFLTTPLWLSLNLKICFELWYIRKPKKIEDNLFL